MSGGGAMVLVAGQGILCLVDEVRHGGLRKFDVSIEVCLVLFDDGW